ncbi:MAG: Tat pathway signal protein [Candidatus Competibacteraceae bacterium]
MSRYDDAVSAMRVRLPAQPELRDYVRFGTLASNSHNTQPWKFRLGADTIDILPDFSRRTPIVDPDDHHLYVTLGCAAQNVVIAANASARPAELSATTDGCEGTVIRVFLGKGLDIGHSTDADLCNAIPVRQSTKSEYDGQALSGSELRQLEEAAALPGVDVLFITERPRMEQAFEFIQEGNSAQMDSPTFVRELKEWIRYNPTAALKSGDGLLGKCSGSPSAPNWLGPMIFDLAFKKAAENKKYARQLRSSAGFVVFVAEKEDPGGWIQVGQSFERFALQATVLGIRHAHLNMPIEVPEVRPAFADWLGIPGRRPDLVIRFGKAQPMPMSIRRPLEAVIVP